MVMMIERLARRRGARGQFPFASEAKRLIRTGGDVVLAKSHRGLHLLARAEPRLRVPLEVLRNAYGSALVIEPVAERARVVAVRIGLERVHLPAVRAALRRRGANPAQEYRGIHYCVLRFEADPADLLGLPAELDELTRGRFSEEFLRNGRLAVP